MKDISLLAIELSTDPTGSDVDKFLELILNNMGKYDLIVTPEFALAEKGVMKKERMDELVEKIRKASESSGTLVVAGASYKDQCKLYNAAELIANGTVQEYLKETTDVADSQLAKENGLEFEKGNKQLPIEWNNMYVGVEICRDHGMGRLNRNIQNFWDKEWVDMQIVIGRDSGGYRGSSDATVNGCVISCDGKPKDPKNQYSTGPCSDVQFASGGPPLANRKGPCASYSFSINVGR